MAPRPPSLLVLLAVLSAVVSASAEEGARASRDQTLADLRTLRDQATDPPVQSHLRNAVSFLERTLDQFSDADHVLDPPQAIDNLRQTIDSCTSAAREALRTGNKERGHPLPMAAVLPVKPLGHEHVEVIPHQDPGVDDDAAP